MWDKEVLKLNIDIPMYVVQQEDRPGRKRMLLLLDVSLKEPESAQDKVLALETLVQQI